MTETGVVYTAPVPSTAAVQPIAVGASPFTYQNSQDAAIVVIVSGGTVTTIQFSRDGTNWYTVGLLAGQFWLNPGDRLRVTYVVAPNMYYVNV